MYCNETLDICDKDIVAQRAGLGVTLSILNEEMCHSRYKTVFITLFVRRLHSNLMLTEVSQWDLRLVEMLGYHVVLIESLIDDLRGITPEDFMESDKEELQKLLQELERQICIKIGKNSTSFKAIAQMKREILVIALNRIFELKRHFK